ncbi:hypothetical protein KFE98_09560 [bacterium SCSIO 12741]|nr:hypothetical protein KFE98_09560 [bacterium SCSIO 12741]
MLYSTHAERPGSNRGWACNGYVLLPGDLSSSHFKTKTTHFTYGLVHRLPFKNNRWAWKNSFLIGRISGDDALSDSEINRNRNLSFTSRLYEFSSQFEFNFFEYNTFIRDEFMTPYLFTGVAFFWFDPKADLDGNAYSLRDYQTEGQSSPYSRFQFALPFGAGLKFKFSHRVLFNVEYGMRRTFTDYLDDVSTTYPDNPSEMGTVAQALSNRSLDNGNGQNEWGMQRGNSQRPDFYAFTTFTMLIRIGKNPNLCKYNAVH